MTSDARANSSTTQSRTRSRGLVERARVEGMLDLVVDEPVVLVCAPAGSGKTVLAGSWAHRQVAGRTIAWVDCSAVADTPTAFWEAVVHALRRAGHPVAIAAERHSAPTERRELLDDLLSSLGSSTSRTVIVCDDFHHVTSAATQADVQYVVDHLPEHVSVVLLTRTVPQLALYRARVDGRLGELRATDLAFTLDETSGLLAANGIELAASAVADLQQHTQGWAAGLRLAIISMLHSTDPAAVVERLSRTTAAVSGYLTEQVLDDLGADDRTFLLDTCVVDTLDGSLVEHLTGRPDGQEHLRRVADRVGFLTPSHDDEEAYRYHPMFAELLRGQLQHEDPERFARQHRRAAGWLHARGRTLHALRHATAARDWDFVGEVVALDLIALGGSGAYPELAEILRTIPHEVTSSDVRLQLARVATLVLADRTDQALPILRQAVERLPSGSDLGSRRLRAVSSIVESLTARYLGDAPWMLRALPPGPDVPFPDTVGYRSQDLSLHVSWRGHRAAALLWDDRTEDAVAEADSLLRLADGQVPAWHTVAAFGIRALIHATSGHLAEADHEIAAAVTVIDLRNWNTSPYFALADLAEAWAAVERCDDDRATDSLGRAQRRWSRLRAGFPGVLIGLLEARVALVVDGDLRRGRQLLDDLEPRRRAIRSAFLDRLCTMVRVETDLAAGDLDDAVSAAAEGPTALQGWVEARCRMHASAGATASAFEEGEGDAWPDGDDRGLLIRELLALAIHARENGDPHEGDRRLDQALDIAEVEGFRHPFLALADRLHPLLIECPVSATRHGALVASLLTLTRPPQRGRHADYTQPLTPREVEILHHLVAGVEVDDIAAQLFVSRNTVRSHVKSIYRKLSANSRREAILRASSLGVI